MYLTSEESRNSMESDESIYSTSTTDLIVNKEVKSTNLNQMNRPKRKREKLDHLTNEEKIMRRKIKNRQSAQSARDRKKMKMTDLQERLEALLQERVQMLKENELLKKRNQKLERENNELLRSRSSNCSDSNNGLLIDPAEFIKVIRQRSQVRHHFNQTIAMIYPMILVMISLVSSLTMVVQSQLKKVMWNCGVNKFYLNHHYPAINRSNKPLMKVLKENMIYLMNWSSKMNNRRIISLDMIKYLPSIPVI